MKILARVIALSYAPDDRIEIGLHVAGVDVPEKDPNCRHFTIYEREDPGVVRKLGQFLE